MSSRVLLAVAIGALLTSLPRLITAQGKPAPGHEASANFDLEDVGPFLQRVVALIDSGFAIPDARALAARIGQQPVKSTREYRYTVVARGVRSPLRIVAFMDDVDAPDLYFYTDRTIAERINAAMKRYFKDVGK